MAASRSETSTLPPEPSLEVLQRNRLGRRIGTAVLAAFVLAGLFGFFGNRTDTVSATGGGYELGASYRPVSRPGLAATWFFTVRRPGGFSGPIRIAVDRDYLESLDLNGLYPSPASELSEGDEVIWEFDPPPGDVLRIEFDGRHEPGVQGAVPGRVAVLDQGGTAVEVEFSTVVLP